ncbi:MAG TPA: Ppx/GppA family phosphatase, partial [Firmicutes bacterium]|nr:Ppx/GppA family phosphatase [Bacillota bacterium]
MEDSLKINEGQIVAFIDIGTNSIRLLMIQYNHDSYRVITQQKETVRLGEGEFSANEYLQPDAIDRAVLVCSKFGELARSYAAEAIIAVATSATRDAENQAELIHRLRQGAGIEVNVISGREEARLIYLGISSGVNLNNQNAFFIDIGGGSTEVIVGNQMEYLHLDSLKLGAIRLAALFPAGDDGPVTPARYASLQRHIRLIAVRTIQKIREYSVTLAFGSSGTIENLAEIACRMFNKRKLQRNDYLDYGQLKQVIGYLCSLPLEDRRKVPGINPDRADIIIAGAAIIEIFMHDLGLERLYVSERSLRDGLLVDYLYRNEDGKNPGTNSLRERSVIQLGKACGFDEFHARKVAELALELYDSAAVMRLHSFEAWERELLEYAALLHDIGAFLSYSNHQMHTFYLICNADLLGFNQTEIMIIATTAFFHRKTVPRKKHPEFSDLEKPIQKIVLLLSAILRLAETLDRSHTGLITHARFLSHEDNLILEIAAAQDCQLELWGLKNHQKAIEEL